MAMDIAPLSKHVYSRLPWSIEYRLQITKEPRSIMRQFLSDDAKHASEA